MYRSVAICILGILLATAGPLAAAKGPEINLIDGKLSVNAESIPLSRLLQLVDLATGMKSKVPPELANRVISVRFSDLPVNDAIRKIFQGQPLDYALISGQGVVVTGTSQSGPAGNESFPPSPINSVQSNEQPFFQEFPGNQQQLQMEAVRMQQQQEALRMQQLQQQQQPPTVQTPFGPIANPRALPPQNQQPAVAAQQNSLFPQTGQAGVQQPQQQPQQQPIPGFPGTQPAGQNPFGTNPFGTPNAPPPANPPNSLFGAVPIFGGGNQQQ